MYYPFSQETRDKFQIVTTSGYGVRWGKFHHGTDYAPTKYRNRNIPIIASADGELATGIDRYGGLWSLVKADNGMGFLSVHHKKLLRTSGRVKAGDEIAYMGSTGNSTGVHVHFEVTSKYWKGKGDLDPEKANLKFYQEGMSFEDFLHWNSLIEEKELTSMHVEMQDDAIPSKLVNRTTELSSEQKDFCQQLLKLNQFIQNSEMKNTKWVDTVLKRYALYVAKSTAV